MKQSGEYPSAVKIQEYKEVAIACAAPIYAPEAPEAPRTPEASAGRATSETIKSPIGPREAAEYAKEVGKLIARFRQGYTLAA